MKDIFIISPSIGIDIDNADDAYVSNVRVEGNDIGIRVRNSNRFNLVGATIIGNGRGTGIQIGNAGDISANSLVEMINQNSDSLTHEEKLDISAAVENHKQEPSDSNLKIFLDKAQSMFSSTASIVTTAKALWDLFTKTNN